LQLSYAGGTAGKALRLSSRATLIIIIIKVCRYGICG
jgi:hypothetical protein